MPDTGEKLHPARGAAAPQRHPGSILRSFVTLSGVSTVSMAAGVAQNMVIAAVIGATARMDAYNVASYIPRMMLYMFGLDLFRGIAISLFSRLDINKSEDPSTVFSTLFNALLLISLAAIVVAEVFVRPLVRIVSPGVAIATSQLAIDLARYQIPTLALVALTSLMGSVLLAHHYYGLTEALAMLPKITALVGILVWGKAFDVWALTFAVIIGLVAEVPVMFWFLHRCALHYRPVLKLRSPAFRSAIWDAVPLGIGTVAIYISEITLQRTVSHGQAGTIACYNYSLLLCGAVFTLICRPISASLAPRVTRSLEAGDYRASGEMLGKALGFAFFICLAGLALIWAEGPLVVDLFYGRGRFTGAAIDQTSHFLAIMFPVAVGFGARMVAIGVLLARRRTKTVMLYCLVTSVIRAGLAIAGQRWWGVYAAAYAYAISHCVDGLLCAATALAIVRLQERLKNAGRIACWIAASLSIMVLPFIPRWIHAVSYHDAGPAKIGRLVLVSAITGLAFLLAIALCRLYPLRRILGILRLVRN
jgi:putative peptidoglycan lipid II flippase